MSEAQVQLRLSQGAEMEVGWVRVCLQVDWKVSESQGGHNPTILILSCPCDDV